MSPIGLGAKTFFMFLLKSFSNVVFGTGNDTLVQLPSGKFYYIDPTASESKKLVYSKASISIKQTSAKFNYEMLITNTPDSNTEEFEDFEASFLIDKMLLVNFTGNRITWKDLEDNLNCRGWEFIVDSSSNKVAIKLFEDTLVGCMFEREYKKVPSELEVQNFIESFSIQVKNFNLGVWKNVCKSF
jgi:hypothetical protein